MKKTIKYGLIGMCIHLIIVTVPDLIFSKINTERYEAIGTLSAIFEMVYEVPLILIRRIFNFYPQWPSLGYLVFMYILGSLFYFFIGYFIAYIRYRTK